MQKIDQHTKKLILKYKDIKNEIRYIMYTWKMRDINEPDIKEDEKKEGKKPLSQQTFYRSFINLEKNTITRKEKERERLMYLFNQKEIVKKEILNSHQKYSYIDNIFTREIEIAEKNQNAFWFLCWYYVPFCSSTPKYISIDNILLE